MAIRAGQMRHSITIQERSADQDPDTGQPLDVWTTFATRRAALERMAGREVLAAAQRQGRVPVLFRLRYLEGVTEAMRVLFDGKLHNVVSAVDPTGLKEELLLTVEEMAGEEP